MPDCPGKLLEMSSIMSSVTFLGLLGTTEYFRFTLLKLCVNLKTGRQNHRHPRL